jgi:hypothetical protein
MTVYCVWVYDTYYPSGAGDLRGIYTNRADAEAQLAQFTGYDHMHITEETVDRPRPVDD